MSEKSANMLTGVAIFLLGILVANIFYVIQNNSLQNIFSKNNNIEENITKNAKIIFTKEQTNFLDYIYSAAVQEVSFCLYGNITNDSIIITSINETIMYNRTTNQVISSYCKDAIGQLHTHPNSNGIKRLSNQDYFSFGWANKAWGYKIEGTIYGKGKYFIVSENNLYNPIQYQIKDS